MLTEYLQHFCDFVQNLWHIQSHRIISKTNKNEIVLFKNVNDGGKKTVKQYEIPIEVVG